MIKKKCLRFYTYDLQSQKFIKVAMRGIPRKITGEDAKEEAEKNLELEIMRINSAGSINRFMS